MSPLWPWFRLPGEAAREACASEIYRVSSRPRGLFNTRIGREESASTGVWDLSWPATEFDRSRAENRRQHPIRHGTTLISRTVQSFPTFQGPLPTAVPDQPWERGKPRRVGSDNDSITCLLTMVYGVVHDPLETTTVWPTAAHQSFQRTPRGRCKRHLPEQFGDIKVRFVRCSVF